MITCSDAECPNPAVARGMCSAHYQRWLATADRADVRAKAPNGSQPTCTAPNCDRRALAKGLCSKHYQRVRRWVPVDQDPRYERGLPLAKRIMRYVDKGEDGCWIWQGGTSSSGHGNMRLGDTSVGAHRAAYEAFVGPIPEGLHLDHVCRTPACVNPAHLRPVTNAENMRRKALTPEEHRAL